MSKFKIAFIFFVTTLFFSQILVFAKSEQFGVATYYPSPKAAYKELILYPNNTPSLCSTASDVGKIYYNSNTKRLEVCSYNNLTYTYLPAPGGSNSTVGAGCDLWYLNSNHLYNNNTGTVFMNKAVSSETPAKNTVLQVNGIYQASTNNEVYPIVSTTTGTYWYANYLNFGGRNAINTGAYYPSGSRYANVVINEVPDYLGLVGVGVRLPKAKLHVAYPTSYSDNWLIFLADTENTYTGTLDFNEPGIAVTRNGDVGFGTWGPFGKLDINLNHWVGNGYPDISIGEPNIYVDGGYGAAGSWYRQYVGFNVWYDGKMNTWRTLSDSVHNGAALISSCQISGDLAFKSIGNTGGAYRVLGGHIYNSPHIYINSSGNVIINGTWGPSKFSVNGSAGGTQCWVVPSDERLKKNIVTIDNAMAKISKLRPVSFEWKQKEMWPAAGRSLGLIAQEVKDIVPEVVVEGDGYYYLEYSSMVGLLVEGIKEQQKEIASLQKAIAQIESEL